MNNNQLLRYSRHIMLDQIGYEGQEKINQATVLLVGLGGLGCPAALYLAASGAGRLILCDHDAIELTNLQRQILYKAQDIGLHKARQAATHLTALNPDIKVETVVAQANSDNLPALIDQADIVLDATDRFQTRHLINRHCVIAKKPLVMASALRFDGQLMVIDPHCSESSCYECVFPEVEGAIEETCAHMGVFAPLTGIMGTLQAAEALKYIINLPTYQQTLLIVNGHDGIFQTFQRSRNPQCKVCAV